MSNFFEAFKKGKELAHSATWKNRATLAGCLSTIISASISLLRFFGIDIPITDEQIIIFSGGIASISFVFLTVIGVVTSKKVGIPPAVTEALS